MPGSAGSIRSRALGIPNRHHCLSMGMGVSVATGLAGIHGRRIHHMPELDHPIVLALMALSRAFLFLLFRRVRWQ